jgi:hypothetical protein
MTAQPGESVRAKVGVVRVTGPIRRSLRVTMTVTSVAPPLIGSDTGEPVELDEQSASWRDPDFAINAVVRDLLVRFRGIGGDSDGLLIFERIDPATTTYEGGLDGLTDAIIARIRHLASRNDAVRSLMDGKKGVGIV